MLKIFNQNHTYLGKIIHTKEYRIETQTASGDKTLSCTVLDQSIDLQTEYYLQNEFDEFVIKEINKTTDGFPSIVCALNLEELEGKAWKTFQLTNNTISAGAQLAIAGTGWTVASSDVTKQRNAGILKKSALGVLNDLCTAFMCEISYDTINKTISFHEKKGRDRGVYFLAGLNLKKLTTKSGTYDFYTRIIPYGADDLDIKSVNSGKEYVENYQYSNKVRTYIWVDTNYTDATALKTDATAKLADMSKPEVSYSADVYDLAAMSDDYGLLDYSVGDTITLIDESTGTREKQRIVKLTEYPDEPERNTCELSNTALTWEEMQSRLQAAAAIIDTVISSDGQYNGTISVSDILHFEDGIVDSGSGTTLANFFETTSGSLGVLELDVGNLKANALTAETADLRYATIANLNAATARITDLETNTITAEYADLHYATIDNLTAATGRISTLEANSLTAATADLRYATIDNLSAATARIATLEANSITAEYANLHYATIDSLTAAVGRITTLEATSLTAEYADLHYAEIDLSNVAVESVKDLLVDTGVIKNATIESGHITGVLDAVTVNASDIVAGTLSVDRLLLRGSTSGIVYALNNYGTITSTQVDTIDGYVLTPRTITADRIVANSITGNEIAAGTITANELAANSVTAAKINVATLSAITANIGEVTAGVLKSANYSPPTSATGNYSAAGMIIDLTNGIIRTKNFAVLANGTVYINTSLTLGGANNTSGTLTVKNASGATIGTWNKDGINAQTGTIGPWTLTSTGLSSGTITLHNDNTYNGSYITILHKDDNTKRSEIYGERLGVCTKTNGLWEMVSELRASTIQEGTGVGETFGRLTLSRYSGQNTMQALVTLTPNRSGELECNSDCVAPNIRATTRMYVGTTSNEAGRAVEVRNTIHDISLNAGYASTASDANAGIYDHNQSKWLIRTNNSGDVYVNGVKMENSSATVTKTSVITSGDITLYRRGNMIQLYGQPTLAQTSAANTQIGTVPDGYRPPARVYFRDTDNRLYRIDADGKMYSASTQTAAGQRFLSTCYVCA